MLFSDVRSGERPIRKEEDETKVCGHGRESDISKGPC